MRAIAGLVLSLLTACSEGNADPVSPPPPARSLVAEARAALASDTTPVAESKRTGDSLVVVIGEEHASVRVQEEVARALDALAAKGLVDVLLVEGFAGTLDTGTFPAAYADPGDGRRLALDELRWGQLAGTDYFALTHQGTPVIGIEDLAARLRFGLAAQRHALESLAITDVDAARLAEIDRAGRCLADGGRVDAALVARARARVATSQKEAQRALAALNQQMPAWFEAMERQIPYRSDRQFMTAFRMFVSMATDPNKAPPADAMALWQLHQARAVAFLKLVEVGASAEKRLEPPTSRLEKAATRRDEELTRLVSELGGRDPQRRCTDTLVHFATRIERPLLEKRELDDRLLGERDDAMVAEIVATARSGHRRIVVVVGAHHLASIAERLERAQLPWISVKARSADRGSSGWEVAAWERRKSEDVDEIWERLASAAQGRDKGGTPLQSPARLRDRAEATRVLTSESPAAGEYAADGERIRTSDGLVLRVGPPSTDPSARVGAHVVRRGPVPGQPGKVHEVIDAAIAREYVKDLSTGDDVFVFPHPTTDGSGRLDFDVPATTRGKPPRTMSEQTFLKAAPAGGGGGKPPRRVIVMHGAEESGPWRRFRADAQKRASDGTTTWMSPLHRGHRPALYETINPERARANLARIKAQDRGHLGPLQVIRGTDLSGLLPTPGRGDHARMAVFLARNDQEFRTAVETAAKDGLLDGKQVALITCGDVHLHTQRLVDTLLDHGAIMVWAPRRQISIKAGERLLQEIERRAAAERRGQHVDELVRDALQRLHDEAPDDPEVLQFEESGPWVQVSPPAPARGSVA